MLSLDERLCKGSKTSKRVPRGTAGRAGSLQVLLYARGGGRVSKLRGMESLSAVNKPEQPAFKWLWRSGSIRLEPNLRRCRHERIESCPSSRGHF